jgi:hypothetical protein
MNLDEEILDAGTADEILDGIAAKLVPRLERLAEKHTEYVAVFDERYVQRRDLRELEAAVAGLKLRRAELVREAAALRRVFKRVDSEISEAEHMIAELRAQLRKGKEDA